MKADIQNIIKNLVKVLNILNHTYYAVKQLIIKSFCCIYIITH